MYIIKLNQRTLAQIIDEDVIDRADLTAFITEYTVNREDDLYFTYHRYGEYAGPEAQIPDEMVEWQCLMDFFARRCFDFDMELAQHSWTTMVPKKNFI